MKRFWLGVALFLVVLSSSLPLVGLVTAPRAEAASFKDLKVTATVVDIAHIDVKVTGKFETDSGAEIDVGSLLSGMYYDNNVQDNFATVGSGTTQGPHYVQGGSKKVGVKDSCQSSLELVLNRSEGDRNDKRILYANNGYAGIVQGAYFKFSISQKGTTGSGCASKDYGNYLDPSVSLQSEGNFAVGYFFNSLSESDGQISGGNISQADNDATYEDANKSYNLPFASISKTFNYPTDNPQEDFGGRCPNYMKVTGNGSVPNTRSGQLYDQDNGGDNGCKLTNGDGNPEPVLVLANKPSEVVQGHLEPGAAGDDEQTGVIYDEKCPIDTWGLKWIVCPIIDAINQSIKSLSEAIQDYVTADAGDIFGNKAVKEAFDSFLIMAISIVIVAAVFMVVSHASGLEFLDAYTIRRYLPMLFFYLGLITILWPLMYWTVSAAGATAHWIGDILYAPFTTLGDQQAADGWSLITAVGAGGALYAALGPLGLISLLITGFVSVLTAIFIITIIKMGLTATIIGMPALVAMRLIPGLEKVSKMGIGVFAGTLVFPIIFGTAVALGKIGAVLFPGSGILKSIATVVFIFGPYLLAKGMAEKSIGALAFVTNMGSQLGQKFNNKQTQIRGNIMKTRGKEFKSGALMRDRGLGAVVNNVGRRVGIGGKAGMGAAMGITASQRRRYRSALAMQSMQEQKETMERNPWLQELQNDDHANAVLGLSGGSEQGMREAARQIFTGQDGVYDEAGANAAMDKARAAAGGRVDRASAAVALRTMAQNKSRAVGAGRVDIVQDGINRLARTNEEAQSFAYTYQFDSRGAGRNDLGGDWMGAGIQQTAQQLRAQDPHLSEGHSMAIANAMDGMGRTTVPQMMNGHTNQARADVAAIQYMLQHGNQQQRVVAAQRATEIAENLSQANGDSQGVFNDFLQHIGVDGRSSVPAAQQIAAQHFTPTPLGLNHTFTPQQIAQYNGMIGQNAANAIQSGARTYNSGMTAAAAAAGGTGAPAAAAPAGGGGHP